MKTMKWLLRREFWENKGAFFTAPLVIALVMLAFVGATLGYGAAAHGIGGVIVVNGHEVSKVAVLGAMAPAARAEVAAVVANTYLAAAAPLFGVLPVVVFFYCLGALYDERREHSILFWKSLPVSDQMTVLSKMLTALCVAPLITIALGTGAALLMLLIGLVAVAFNGLNLFGPVLGNLDFYLAPLRLIGLLPVYVLWAIPTVGYLLMVSAWARSKVLLWAVGVPALLIALAKWANFILGGVMNGSVDWFIHNIVLRGLSGLIPGMWLPYGKVSTAALLNDAGHTIDAGSFLTQSWMTLTQPDVWVGAVAGGAMIFVAIRLRRWRDES